MGQKDKDMYALRTQINVSFCHVFCRTRHKGHQGLLGPQFNYCKGYNMIKLQSQMPIHQWCSIFQDYKIILTLVLFK